jgi:tetratricopeptide (TPR) repeat protein
MGETTMREVFGAIGTHSLFALTALAATLLICSPGVAAELRWPQKLELVQLLRDGEYAALESELVAYQDAYERGEITEDMPTYAVSAFAYADPALETLFAEWIIGYPESYAARLARGVYYSHLAWLSRGKNTIGRTPAARIRSMRAYFDLAQADFEHGLALNRKAITAYAGLIKIAMAGGDDEMEEAFFEAGLKIAPNSYDLHRARILSLRPRWGGSLDQVSDYVDALLERFPDDERLAKLSAFPDYLVAKNLSHRGEYDKAVRYFDRAVDVDTGYLIDRGFLHWRFGRYELALADYERALERHFQNPELLYFLAVTYLNNDKDDDDAIALTYIDQALEFDPYNPDYLWLKASYINQTEANSTPAIPVLEKALVYGANDHTIQEFLGLEYKTSEIPENMPKAVEAFRRAVELMPGKSSYWQQYLHALRLAGNCDYLGALRTYVGLCAANGACSEQDLETQRRLADHFVRNVRCG